MAAGSSHSRAWIVVGAMALALTGEAARAQTIEHFKVYEIPDSPVAAQVDLVDQFGTLSGVDLQVVDLFATPVEIDGSGLQDPAFHLKGYPITGPALELELSVSNLFGTELWSAGTPSFLLVESVRGGGAVCENDPAVFCSTPGDCAHVGGACLPPPPPPVDPHHFNCYSATGPSPAASVQLTDAFGVETVTVGAPRFLCNPAQKNQEPIQDPEDHLACYDITPKTPPLSSTTSTDQFGIHFFVPIQNSEMLCVASSKTEVSGVPALGPLGVVILLGLFLTATQAHR